MRYARSIGIGTGVVVVLLIVFLAGKWFLGGFAPAEKSTTTAVPKPTPKSNLLAETRKQVEKLIAGLGGGASKTGVSKAQDALVQVGQPGIEKLIEVLYDTDQQVAFQAAWALIRIGQPAVKPLLEELSRCEDGEEILRRIRYVLRHIGPSITEVKILAQERRLGGQAEKIMEEIGREKFTANVKTATASKVVAVNNNQDGDNGDPEARARAKAEEFALALTEARKKASIAQKAVDEARKQVKEAIALVKKMGD
mgnify:CR=1 FL=1